MAGEVASVSAPSERSQAGSLPVVHSHFHGRRTGVTGHVEAMVRASDAAVIGWGVAADVRRISVARLLARCWAGPVVWHAHRNGEFLTAWLLRLLLRLLRRRLWLVFTRHAQTPPTPITRWCMRRADAVIALTPQMAALLPVQAHVVGHGVDVDRFAAARDANAAPAIGVIGRIRPLKGQGDFVAAMAPLCAEHPDWRVLLVGDALGDDLAWLERLKATLGERLECTGFQEDTRPWYQQLSVVVHPSHSEGFSLVWLEAMASGCCLVASRLPNFPPILEDGKTGFFFTPGDVDDLRRVLGGLLADPARVFAVGQAAQRYAREHFSVARQAEQLQTIYRDLARGAA